MDTRQDLETNEAIATLEARREPRPCEDFKPASSALFEYCHWCGWTFDNHFKAQFQDENFKP